MADYEGSRKPQSRSPAIYRQLPVHILSISTIGFVAGTATDCYKVFNQTHTPEVVTVYKSMLLFTLISAIATGHTSPMTCAPTQTVMAKVHICALFVMGYTVIHIARDVQIERTLPHSGYKRRAFHQCGYTHAS